MSDQSRWPRRWRAGTSLAVGVLVGMMLITPAGAHVGGSVKHLWNKHLKSLVIGLGDPRWVNTDEAAGGDISGPHGNLQIGSGAIGSTEIANAAVRNEDLGVSAWTFNTVSVANNTAGTVIVSCPAGHVALSGGASWDVPGVGTRILLSRPSFDGAGDATSWRVDGENASGATRVLAAFVLCIQM